MADPLRDKRQPGDTEVEHTPNQENTPNYPETVEWVHSLMEQQEEKTADNGSFVFDSNGAEYSQYVDDINKALEQATTPEDILRAIHSVGGAVITVDGHFITTQGIERFWNALLDEIRSMHADETQWKTLFTKKGSVNKNTLTSLFRRQHIPEVFLIASKYKTYITERLQNNEIPEVVEFTETNNDVVEESLGQVETGGEQAQPVLGWEQRVSQAKTMADIITALESLDSVQVKTTESDIEYTRDDIAKIMTEIVWGGRDYLRELPVSLRVVIENKIRELDLVQFTFASQRRMYETTARFDQALQDAQTSDQLWQVLQEFGGVAHYEFRNEKDEIPSVIPISVYELQAIWNEMEQYPEKRDDLSNRIPERVGEFLDGGGVEFREKLRAIFAREHQVSKIVQDTSVSQKNNSRQRRRHIDSDDIEDNLHTSRQRIEDGAPQPRKLSTPHKINAWRNSLRRNLAQEDKEIQKVRVLALDDTWESMQEPWWYGQRYAGLREIFRLLSSQGEREQARDRFIQIVNERHAEALRYAEALPSLKNTDSLKECEERENGMRDILLPLNSISAQDILGVDRYQELTQGAPQEVSIEEPAPQEDQTVPKPEPQPTPIEPPVQEENPPVGPQPEQPEREIDWQEQETLAQRFWERQQQDRRDTLRSAIQTQLQGAIDAGNTEFRLTFRSDKQSLTDRDQERFAAHRMIARELGFLLGDFAFEQANRRTVLATLEPLAVEVVEESEQLKQTQPAPAPSPQPQEQEPEEIEVIRQEERVLTEEERFWQTQHEQATRYFNSFRNEARREEMRGRMIANIQSAIKRNAGHFFIPWHNRPARFTPHDQNMFSAHRMIAHGLGYRLGDFEFATGRNNTRIARARLDLLAAVAPTPTPQEQPPTPAPQEQQPQQQQRPQETPEQRAQREARERAEREMKERIERINVSADEVQEGRRKAIALGISDPEIIKMLDHKEVAQNHAQLFQEVSDVVLAKETWFGRAEYTGTQSGHQTGEHHLGTREQEVIQKMIDTLGPNAQNIPEGAQLTEGFCRDLFYSAKRQILENAMLGKKLGQPYQDNQTGNAYAEASTRRERSRSKLGGMLGRTVGWGAVSLGAFGLLSSLGWGLPIVAITGLRAVDGLLRHNKQRCNVNKWKEENYEAARGQLLHSFSFSVANYVENTNRNRIRAEQGENQGPPTVDDYYNRFLTALRDENNTIPQGEPRLTEEDLQSRAMRFALYYSTDDDAKTRYQEAMEQRSQGRQHGFHEFFGTVADDMRVTRPLGFTKQDRNRGILWHNTSPRDKAFAGATALGVGLGMSLLRSFGLVGAAAAGAYSGWKMGGALADSGGIGRPWGGPQGRWGFALRTGRHSPETNVEQTFRALESRNKQVGEYEKTLQKIQNELTISDVTSVDAQLQPMLKMLAEVQPYLENVKNHHEFSHQYERFKKLSTKVMHLKLLAEWERPLWSTQENRVRQDGLRTGEKSIPQKFETIQQAGGSLSREYTGFREDERTRSGMYRMRNDNTAGENILDLRNTRRRLVYKIGGAVIGAFLLGALEHWREVAHAQDVGPVGPHGPVPGPDISHIPDSAIVGRGEGIEHVLQRQLGQNNDAFSYFSQRYGTTNRGNLAHLIARDYGYVDNFGHEVRVLDTGVYGSLQNPAYWLHKTPQGTWEVGEYTFDPTRHSYTPFEAHTVGTGFEHPSDVSHEYDFSKPHDVTPPPTPPQGGSVRSSFLEEGGPPRGTEGVARVSSSSPSPLQGEGGVRFEPLKAPSPQGIIQDGNSHELPLPNTDAHLSPSPLEGESGRMSSSPSPLQGEGGVRFETSHPSSSHIEALRESIGVTGDIPTPLPNLPDGIGVEEANILTSFHAIHKDADVENISTTLEHLSKDQGGPWNHITMHNHHAWVRPVTDPNDIARFSHGVPSSPSPLQGEGGVRSEEINLFAVKFGASNPQTPDLVLEQLPKGNEKIISIRNVLPNGTRGHELHDYTAWLKNHPIKGTDTDIGTVDVIPNAHSGSGDVIAEHIISVDTVPLATHADHGKIIQEHLSYEAGGHVNADWLDRIEDAIDSNKYTIDEISKNIVSEDKKSDFVAFIVNHSSGISEEKATNLLEAVCNTPDKDHIASQKSSAVELMKLLETYKDTTLKTGDADIKTDQETWYEWSTIKSVLQSLPDSVVSSVQKVNLGQWSKEIVKK